MDFMINFVIIALFIFPFIALIHEAGHAFFLKLFGGEISEFSIGNGDVLWKRNKFTIRKAYFAGGKVVTPSLDRLSTAQKALFFLGGVIFNLLSAIALDVATGYEWWVFRSYLDSFIFVSYLNVVINLVPLITVAGKTDGKKLTDLLQN